MSKRKICVLGAGIVGLTTALQLQERFPKDDISIVADKFNTETTSDGAAGLWSPSLFFQGPTPEMTNKILKDSYEYYDCLRVKLGADVTGIVETSGYALSNLGPDHVENPLIDQIVPEFRILSEEEIKDCPASGEWKYGAFFKSLLIQGRIFLPWALKRFQNAGGKVTQKKIESFEELIPYGFDMIVNCTGFGSKSLCQDKNLVPIRGQVIKVSAPWEKHFIFADNDIYIIPGFETTLGGSKNFDNYDLGVDKHISAQIWEKCTNLLPSLKESVILREWTGLRPHRAPLRLETEFMNFDGKTLKVVHNYGHGAQGITCAPGSAKIAVNLVDVVLKQKSKL